MELYEKNVKKRIEEIKKDERTMETKAQLRTQEERRG